MEQNWRQKVGKVLHKNYKLVTHLYLALMLLLYIGYIVVESYKQNKSEHWISKVNITQEDIQSISLVGTWTSSIEVMFLALFVMISSIVLIFYPRNKKVLMYLLLIHLVLFIAILLASYTLTFITPLPIGNLTQPLITPIFLLVIISTYLGFIRIKEVIQSFQRS